MCDRCLIYTYIIISAVSNYIRTNKHIQLINLKVCGNIVYYYKYIMKTLAKLKIFITIRIQSNRLFMQSIQAKYSGKLSRKITHLISHKWNCKIHVEVGSSVHYFHILTDLYENNWFKI